MLEMLVQIDGLLEWKSLQKTSVFLNKTVIWRNVEGLQAVDKRKSTWNRRLRLLLPVP
jgi:hypothetical protein